MFSLQHYPSVHLGLTGGSFRPRRCDEYGCAVFQHSSQMHHHGSATFFNKGNHTTEMFVLSHHFSRSGFEFDFATVAGKPIALEGWTVAEAWGSEDVIKAMRDSVVDGLTSPKKFDDITNLDEYAAVFIPGGHIPEIDLNLCLTLGAILCLAHSRDVTMISLCHGPNAGRQHLREISCTMVPRLDVCLSIVKDGVRQAACLVFVRRTTALRDPVPQSAQGRDQISVEVDCRHGEARDQAWPSALTFVTVLLTLKTMSLVELEYARLAEIGIFEL